MTIKPLAVETGKKNIRLYYTSDVHGSTTCFKKFVNSAKAYEADIIILGGDLSGKLIIPIYKQDDGTYSTKFQERKVTVDGDSQLKELLAKIRFTGAYYTILNKGDETKFASEAEREQLFLQVLRDATREWVQLAEERLKGSSTICLVMPGNDDPKEIDPILETSSRVVNPEGKLITINGSYELVSCSYGNITPWSCPRDIEEKELEAKLESVCSMIKSASTAVFNFHVPPYDSNLDLAPKLDKNLKMETEMGQPVMIPVGSHAVRHVIEKYQPLVGLHGHIHESKGTTMIGRTFCVNPGSEYAEGLLHGVLIDLEKGKMQRYVLTQG
jgi:hypothetical protein